MRTSQLVKAPNDILKQLCDLGRVSCVSLRDWSAVLRRSLQIAYHPTFSTLRELSVSVTLTGRIAGEYILLSPLPSFLPRLRSLLIQLDVSEDCVSVLQDYDAEPIGRLEQLRSLTLVGFSLAASALLCLCSMRQLTTLHLGGCVLADQAGIAPAHYDMIEVKPAWSKLVLPRYSGWKVSVPSVAPPEPVSGADDALASVDYLLRGAGGLDCLDGLSFLWYCRWPSTRLLSQLPSLTSLGIHLSSGATYLSSGTMLGDAAADLSSFIHPHPQQSPCLHELRHLAVTWEPRNTEVPLPVYTRILAAYSPQLLSLDLRLPQTVSWSALLDAVLSCSSLRRLALHGYSSSNITDAITADRRLADNSPNQRTRLIHLHTLQLHHICLLDAQLIELLHCSPSLEDITLYELNSLSIAVLAELGTCRPRLRRLRVQTDNVAFLSGQRDNQPAEAAAPSLASSFSSLSILSIVCSRSDGFHFAPHTVIWLVAVLGFASRLRYLRLDVDMPLHQLRLFSRFPRLTALRVWHSTLPHGDVRHFFTANPLAAEGQEDRVRGSDRSQQGQRMRAVSALELGSEVLSSSAMISAVEHLIDFPVVFVDEASGRSGRESFFNALPATYAAPVQRVADRDDEEMPRASSWCCL